MLSGLLVDQLPERDLEGVVGKRAGSRYRPGPVRSGDWVKIKRQRDDELVVVGWVPGKGSRQRLGALELGSYAGERLVYRGKVGSGLGPARFAMSSVLARLDEMGDLLAGLLDEHPDVVEAVSRLEALMR